MGPRLSGLFSLVTGTSTVPAVLVAALVHGELASLAPFGTADGVVARAAARLTGITRGLDPKAVSVPEVGFVELGGEAYSTALAGYASSVFSPAAVTVPRPWSFLDWSLNLALVRPHTPSSPATRPRPAPNSRRKRSRKPPTPGPLPGSRQTAPRGPGAGTVG